MNNKNDRMNAAILDKLSTKCPFPDTFKDVEIAGNGVKLYPRNKIGHIRADHDGWRWWNTVWRCHDELATPEMKREIDATYKALTKKDALCDLDALTRFCKSHPEACVGDPGTEYNFYLVGNLCDYWIRLITRKRDYNMYLSAYVKKDSQ